MEYFCVDNVSTFCLWLLICQDMRLSHVFHTNPSHAEVQECLACPFICTPTPYINFQNTPTLWSFLQETKQSANLWADKEEQGATECKFSRQNPLKTSPLRNSRITSVLVFMVDCRTGPMTMVGFTVTTSRSCSFAKSHAAFSASVFDKTYHRCKAPVLYESEKATLRCGLHYSLYSHIEGHASHSHEREKFELILGSVQHVLLTKLWHCARPKPLKIA